MNATASGIVALMIWNTAYAAKLEYSVQSWSEMDSAGWLDPVVFFSASEFCSENPQNKQEYKNGFRDGLKQQHPSWWRWNADLLTNAENGIIIIIIIFFVIITINIIIIIVIIITISITRSSGIYLWLRWNAPPLTNAANGIIIHNFSWKPTFPLCNLLLWTLFYSGSKRLNLLKPM